MDTKGIDNLLAQLRAASAAMQDTLAPRAGAAVAGADFPAMLKSSLDGVNRPQLDSLRLSQEFELGTGNVNLSDVMISLQKANLSFQQAVQVRNRLVSAYHDIMNMQV